jgi:CubicO group peptidase (beta-lactamase class C family)
VPDGPLGVVVGVACDTGTRIARAGARDSLGRPLATGTRFDVASVTKVAATTTTLHRLASIGVLTLDEPVHRFVPTTNCAPDTTLATLMQHRAGLWEWQPLYLARAADGTTPTAAEAMDALPLRYPAGERRAYSDLGFILLGRVVAAVTGQPLDQAVAELVTGPLGLAETGYGPVSGNVAASAPDEAIEREMVRSGEPYPVLYERGEVPWRTHELIGEVDDGNCFHALGGISGHAGLFSTVPDLLRLGRSLARAGERDDLWRPDVTSRVFEEGPDEGQALGWRTMGIEVQGVDRTMLWHPGFTGCAVGFVPDTGIAVAMLSNRLMSASPQPTAVLWATALTSLGLLPTTEGSAA